MRNRCLAELKTQILTPDFVLAYFFSKDNCFAIDLKSTKLINKSAVRKKNLLLDHPGTLPKGGLGDCNLMHSI